MSLIAQCMTVSATIGNQWLLQNVATHVLDPVKQVVIGVFDQLGGRRLVRTAVTGTDTTAWKTLNALPICGRGETPPCAGSVQQLGDDDSSVYRLERCVTQSVRTE